MRKIDVLLFDGINALDVTGPVQCFETANQNNRGAYDVRFVAVGSKTVRSDSGLKLQPDGDFSSADSGHDLLIPGGSGVDSLMKDHAVLEIVRSYAKNCGRTISVCSGAMVLAAAGVLDGLSATTHWTRQQQTQCFPEVAWDLDRISISQGNVFTSAGVTTGIDLALALVQADCGPAVALAVARELVVQLRRTGGQSQYAFHLVGQFTGNDGLAHLIERIVANPQLDWSLDAMAEASGTHPRTLTRRFKSDLNETPAQFVEKVRLDHARNLLHEKKSLKLVARDSGFGDVQRMRRAFHRRFGVQPNEYRAMFS